MEVNWGRKLNVKYRIRISFEIKKYINIDKQIDGFDKHFGKKRENRMHYINTSNSNI